MKNILKVISGTIFFSAFIFLIFEFVFFGYFYFLHGESLSVREMLAREDNNFMKAITKSLDFDYSASLAQHPYLGFVHNSNPPCNDPNINKSGFFG